VWSGVGRGTPNGVRQKLGQKTKPIVVPRWGTTPPLPQPGDALIPLKRDSLPPGYIISPALGLSPLEDTI